MSKIGKYIYGIINSNAEEIFDLDKIVSLDDIYPSRSSAEIVESSEIHNKAYTVVFQDISAVVSDSEVVDYSHMPKIGRASCRERV